ncbi:MAG TPA: 4Fe-4S dicluster domain-containing protein [Anaerolineales bacterium]|nr:4Fe-4S dicluster domain-containing protein [Anaerolineales bacterium]
MSLIDAAERFAAMDHSTIALDAARCLHSIDRNAECAACFTCCPVDAIVPGKPPALDPERCESCLACLPVCPTGAYSADDAVSALLNATAHVESTAVELVCELHPQPEMGSEGSIGIGIRGCLAGLGAGAYVALAPFGLEHVIARNEACAACRWSALQAEITAQVESARRLLASWDKRDSVAVSSGDGEMVVRPVWNADNPPLSRRELFRMMARRGQVAMARAMENGVHPAGRRPGRDHLRLVGGIEHLPLPRADDTMELGEFGFATVSLTEACTACGACARACPTEALKLEKGEDNASFALTFSARMCIGCDLCSRVCMPQAITVDHSPGFSGVFKTATTTLLEGELVACPRCGALVAKRADNQLCDLCEFRRTHPFGSVLPPGFKPSRPDTASEAR